MLVLDKKQMKQHAAVIINIVNCYRIPISRVVKNSNLLVCTGWVFLLDKVFAGYRIPDTFQKFQIATTGYWILASTGCTEQDTKSLLSFIKQLSIYKFFYSGLISRL